MAEFYSPEVKVGGHSATANSAIVLSSVFSPQRPTVIVTDDKGEGGGKITVSTNFKWTFLAVLGLTLLMLFGQVVYSFFSPLNPNQQELFSALGWGWKAGFGAIVGLLGGKTL